jgi:Uma2 family endonuclease
MEEDRHVPTAELTGMPPDRFLQFCGDDDGIYEMIRGEVIQLAPAGMEHSEIEGETFVLLRSFVKERDLGTVWTGDAGFILERDPFTVRSPDVAFVSKARIPAQLQKGFFPGAPDLAVEILFPTDSLKSVEPKVMMYLRAGSGVVWVLNPRDQTLRIYRNGEETQVRGPNDEADAEPALPEFRCPVARLFGA